jgi:hypothetical protein
VLVRDRLARVAPVQDRAQALADRAVHDQVAHARATTRSLTSSSPAQNAVAVQNVPSAQQTTPHVAAKARQPRHALVVHAQAVRVREDLVQVVHARTRV